VAEPLFPIPPRLNLATHVLDARVAEGLGARAALVTDERRVTYAALLDETNRVANVLSAMGVGRGDRVLIVLPDGVPFVTTALATLKVGAVVTMANPELPAADYAAHLEYTRARVLVTDAALAGRAAA
jgi:acyl-coenzyme A synthetase/AMP-(fatty) acid ligase